jgi:hypothetical protein
LIRLPLEQRLDLRGEPGDLAFELCIPRLELPTRSRSATFSTSNSS